MARPLDVRSHTNMSERMSFGELEPRYVLTGVRMTNQVLGVGPFAVVVEVEYNGLKCAGKMIHGLLWGGGLDGGVIEEECCLLTRLHHPNIVQFLGVYFLPEEKVLPVLVMECLHTNLKACIERHGILPKKISYSILHDIAQGLHYLHCQTPPIVHQGLSSFSILLTSKMMAKIDCFRTSRFPDRMVSLTHKYMYMAPEAMVEHPRYDISIDVFSYGIVMIHMFSGEFPHDVLPSGYADKESDRLCLRSEAERREKYLQAIGSDYPAMELILKCICNDPRMRPATGEILQQLKRINQKSEFILVSWYLSHLLAEKR